MPREAKVPIPHSMWVEDLIYICSHLISPCCSTCWSVVFRFSISSPGDFISFPHLFDHFIKGLISFPKLVDQFIKKMLPTYLFIYHLVSSAVPSFPNLFLQLIITVFFQFSKVFPTCWCMLSFDFIRNSFTAHMTKNLSVIFWSFWNKKISESKCSDIFPSGICIQNVFESYNILLPMSFSNKFLDTWKDNA